MGKIFVLDTNVLIHDPEAILYFADNDIVLPITVIEELDKLKRGEGEIPYSARKALRLIDSFREIGKLSTGVALPGGGIIRVVMEDENYFHINSNDNRIITTAKALLAAKENSKPVILVSKDTSVRIKADAMKIPTQDYLRDKVKVSERYGGIRSDKTNTNGIDSVRYFSTEGDKIFRAYGKEKMEQIRRMRSIMGVAPKNCEQECAMDALLTPEINVVALTGVAGTGKTLLAIAAGLHLVIKSKQKGQADPRNKYEQVMVARPIVPLGNDLGYLPGDIKEKLHPWMQPIYDNLDVVVSTSDENITEKDNGYKSSDYLIESGIIHIEPLTYIRGRSLPGRYLIIDEAQNLRPLDVKTIITRCGEGTKVVFTGDLEQIDSPFLDSASNGLSYLINRFIQQENFCYLNMKHSVRSALAEQAAMLL